MDDPVDVKSAIFQLNRRKIYKWVFFLLKEHHRRVGLKVWAYSAPSGIATPRFSFFFDRIRDENGRPMKHFELNGQTVEMQIYQWKVGVFQPLREGEPKDHPLQSKKELRTKDMLPWLNEQLRIRSLCSSLGKRVLEPQDDPAWQHRSERYLLSWNVLGLYLAKQQGFIRLQTVDSSWDYVKPDYIEDVKRFLPEADWDDVLVFPTSDSPDQRYWLHTGRIVRKDGESLDFYQLMKGGMPLEQVSQRVAEFMGEPRPYVEGW